MLQCSGMAAKYTIQGSDSGAACARLSKQGRARQGVHLEHRCSVSTSARLRRQRASLALLARRCSLSAILFPVSISPAGASPHRIAVAGSATSSRARPSSQRPSRTAARRFQLGPNATWIRCSLRPYEHQAAVAAAAASWRKLLGASLHLRHLGQTALMGTRSPRGPRSAVADPRQLQLQQWQRRRGGRGALLRPTLRGRGGA